jgi:6-phosphofructokinase 1
LGGDGTLRGASDIAKVADKRNLPISVIGIPKTIDNDIQWVMRSFGFTTAVQLADSVLHGAHMEARGAWNGVGLVKLMGRDSGFIAAEATLANSNVNFCLIPEVPFALEGEGGFLAALERRLDRKHHALIAVAEGAGKHILQDVSLASKDESGNLRYLDIGLFLCDKIRSYFKAKGKAVDVKYIDPSYSIRSVPANALDSELCLSLGQHAVHAGIAGRTDMMVGFWNQNFTHVPIAPAVSGRQQIDPNGPIWQRVIETTGQPQLVYL